MPGIFGDQFDAVTTAKLNLGYFISGSGSGSAVGQGTVAPICDGDNSLAHGSDSRIELGARDGALALGLRVVMSAPAPINGRAAGVAVGVDIDHQGDFGAVSIGDTIYNYGFNNVVIGNVLTVGGPGTDSAADGITVGYFSEVHSGFSCIIGNSHFAQKSSGGGSGGMLILGYGNTGIFSDISIIVGNGCRSDGKATISHGQKAHSLRNRQRTFAANRNVLGACQWSFLPFDAVTPDATPLVFETFKLEAAKTYKMKLSEVAAVRTSAPNIATGFLDKEFTVVRDALGAVVVYSPGGLSLDNTGLGHASAGSYALALAAGAAGVTIGPDGGTGFEFTATTVIRNDGGDWATDGLAIGDLVTIALAEDAGNNGITEVTGISVGTLTFGLASFTPNAADTLATFTKVGDTLELTGTGDVDPVQWGYCLQFGEIAA